MEDDDDAQFQQRRQRRDGDADRDDKPGPRRSSPPHKVYDDRDERDRYRSRPQPRGDDPRGPPSRPDRRAAAGGGGGPRPSQQQGGRDRRDNRYDTRMRDVDDDRSSQWDSRERSSRSRGSDRRDYYDERDRRDRNPSRSHRPNNTSDENIIRGESATVAKRNSWFTSKTDTAKAPPSDEVKIEDRRGVNTWDNTVSPFLPPPPPPPPPPFPPPPPTDESLSNMDINPAQTDRVPIHYMFPTADTAATERQITDVQMNDDEINTEKSKMGEEDAMDVPFLDVEEEFVDRDRGRRRRIRDGDEDVDDDDLLYRRASPRRDAVTIFMSTRRGAMKVRVGSMIVGAAIGGFIGKSLTNDPITMAVVMSTLLFITGFLRNDYGELSRALGLAFVLTLGRTSSVRKDYPTLPHLKAMIRQSPRKPFPPVEDGVSPWRYEPIYRDDPDFKMTYALLAMSCVGSFCGGNVPIIPAWIGGIVGAAIFASMTMGDNARGDLGRTMGMRLVGLIQLVLAINSELRILGKAATVGGLIFDKVMIMDRKHRIKDKIVAICKWGYDKVSKTAEQVKEDLQDERPLRR
ncbi:hypothetical protein ACHAXH_007250 [Discostella pseudostelligera]